MRQQISLRTPVEKPEWVGMPDREAIRAINSRFVAGVFVSFVTFCKKRLGRTFASRLTGYDGRPERKQKGRRVG
jgi:hypothetical protein